MLPITGLYAGILGIIILWLCLNVVKFRRGQRVEIGDGGDALGIRHIRAQQNAVEYIPIALILFALVEINGGNPIMMHIVGVVLVFARIIHPVGLVKSKGANFGRFWGTALTWLVLIFLAGFNVGQYIGSFL